MSSLASAQQAQPAGPAVSDGELWKNTVQSLLNFDQRLIADLRHALDGKDLPPSSRQEILLKAMGYNPPWTSQARINYLTNVMYIDTDTVKLRSSLLQESNTEALHKLVRLHHGGSKSVIEKIQKTLELKDESVEDRLTTDRYHLRIGAEAAGYVLENRLAVYESGTASALRKNTNAADFRGGLEPSPPSQIFWA
ncbi:hypothetical protein QFC24_003662 [Naganishia onofrii]|uniref:Uncharacterized protein n=1 Tax=Naganishia onofrii TaxID=1851511 RepID=A0ACC2XHY9_9TREE|nr:hypothetical protein QFC24_003662 [Naganishia onofrii]